ncbi:MAG: type II/IV secretion system ATPase subunit [Desulfurococcales archaeon]|nr:type II/IV secretion system ATPase subunit [Desulfurococcales archaeon]
MEILHKYMVGVTEVTIIRNNDGSYLYVATEKLSAKTQEELRRSLDKLIQSLPDSRRLNFYDLIKTAKEILGKSDEEATALAYAIRKELKYKKLQILIEDPYVEDISIVGPGAVWVRHKLVLNMDPKADYIATNITLSEQEFLTYLNMLAEKSGKLLTKSSPILDANLPEEDGGHRIHLVLPDIADGRGEIVIRKKKSSMNVRLNDLKKLGTINDAIINYVREVIEKRGSLVIVGPPGSGKTTLLRAILYDLIPKSWKIVIIEDTPEIDIPPNSCWVRYIVPISPWGRRHEDIDQMVLAKAALRASANRFLVIGETRGAEAKVLVQALNMGLGGLTTFHGGSAEEAITRLMSPPISLTPPQIGMFWAFITVSYIVETGIKRVVVSIDEPFYDREVDDVVLHNIFTYGEEVAGYDIIERSRKLRPYMEVRKAVTLVQEV